MEQNKKEEQEEDIMILTPVLENARKMLVAVLV